MRQSVAVLQPSLFEGWSTTVEEAKSIGKTILLSDIPVHREQAPPRRAVLRPDRCRSAGEHASRRRTTRAPRDPTTLLEAQAREALPERTRAYADTFIDIVRDAMAR